MEMKGSRVSCLEANKKMGLRNTFQLTGIDYLKDVNFYLFFSPSKGRVFITAHPNVIKTGRELETNQLSGLKSHRSEGLLFSDMGACRVRNLYYKVRSVMQREFKYNDLVRKLEEGLSPFGAVICTVIHDMVSENGLLILTKHPQYLAEHPKVHSGSTAVSVYLPKDDNPLLEASRKWWKRSLEKS